MVEVLGREEAPFDVVGRGPEEGAAPAPAPSAVIVDGASVGLERRENLPLDSLEWPALVTVLVAAAAVAVVDAAAERAVDLKSC